MVLKYREDPLWSELSCFVIGDSGDQFDFIDRLARDNNWSVAFAQRVFNEYLRFLFLAVRAGHSVTPSDEVDQAWHLHLVYSKSYWIDLCQDVLNEPLHHNPTRGGIKERTKFKDWYERTLASYAEFFESEPPVDIWPPCKNRFSKAPTYKRVSTSDYLMIPKGRLIMFMVGCLMIILAGCDHVFANVSGHDFLWKFVFSSIYAGLIGALGFLFRDTQALLAKMFYLPWGFCVLAGILRIYQGVTTGHDVGGVIVLTLINGCFLGYVMGWIKLTKSSSSDGCSSSGDSSGCGGCGGCGD